jgi:uncharacterized protein (DUF58 family)
VLTLAIAEQGWCAGERIALWPATPADGEPQGHIAHAETLAVHEGDAAMRRAAPPAGFPLLQRCRRRFRSPETIAALTRWLEIGVTGHLVQILDPGGDPGVRGPHEFRAPEGSERWIADRVETLRPEYQRKLAAHRARIEEAAHRIGWSFLVHHTDRPASEPLLTLIMRLQGMADDYRWKTQTSVPAAGAGGTP